MKIRFIIFFVFVNALLYSQSDDYSMEKSDSLKELIHFQQIKTDSLFDSNQIISLITVPNKAFDQLCISLDHNNSIMTKTSEIGKRDNAIAAINGGFYNMKTGESITYFEIEDTVISKTKSKILISPNLQSILNGAILINKNCKPEIELANTDKFYQISKQESAVLVTGPLLLHDSELLDLPNTSFINNRHPRTCMCKTKNTVLFIVIDGRSEFAEGMSLIEVQTFLNGIGCIDAINLDGGGSTTMWTKENGIMNFPSDKSGERPVSNAILIIDN